MHHSRRSSVADHLGGIVHAAPGAPPDRSLPAMTTSLRVLLAVTLFVEATLVTAQRPARAPADSDARRIDPYTRNEPPAMAAAGIARYEPFMLGADHGTLEVDALLGGVQMLWMETAHFKFGANLPAYPMPKEPVERNKIRAELEQLRKVLPTVPLRPRSLDPWLRLHLLAQRIESLYLDFQKRLGVTDADFPRKTDGIHLDENFMGMGPYLGQPEKFVILITQHASSLGRYTNKYLGEIYRFPKRHNYGWTNGLLFCTALEFDGWLDGDTALHCHVVYNVVQNLCDGFKHYSQDVPVWFKSGLAQWYARRIDPRFNNYDRPPGGEPDSRTAWDWEPKVVALVRFDHVRSFAELTSWFDYASYSFADYMISWSRVDYLMSLGDERFSIFMHRMKTPIMDGRTLPSRESVLALQDLAIKEAWNTDLATMDRNWRAYVLEHYGQKR
jgi:hypothetical protein